MPYPPNQHDIPDVDCSTCIYHLKISLSHSPATFCLIHPELSICEYYKIGSPLFIGLPDRINIDWIKQNDTNLDRQAIYNLAPDTLKRIFHDINSKDLS